MAVCPFAVKKLIPAGSNDPRIEPRVAILHVDAGNTYDLYEFFRDRSGGIESHFHIAKDGRIFQYRDTNWQADANHHANDFGISIETQGYGAGEWTPEQIASIKKLLLWLNEVHNIPLVKCPKWDGSGVGYHVQFGAPGMWTPVAKSCPGPDRIKQFHNVLVPWMSSDPSEEDDMPNYDREIDQLLNGQRKILKRLNPGSWLRQSINEIGREIEDLEKDAKDDATKNQAKRLNNKLRRIEERLEAEDAEDEDATA